MTGSHSPVTRVTPWIVSGIAILAALWLAQRPVLRRISFVVSDSIARQLGVSTSDRVVLVRLDQSFPKETLQRLLANALPTLVRDYQVEVLGVDIDFSHGEGAYDGLAREFVHASKEDPELDKRTVWAISYESNPEKQAGLEHPNSEDSFCEECFGNSCKTRFTPRPVFGGKYEPGNYGLSIALPDLDNVNRSAPRFVCHSDTEMPIKTFHFRIVESYCSSHLEIATCRDLQQNKQARTRIYSWYRTEPIDICRLVDCHGDHLGARLSHMPEDSEGDLRRALAQKIAILYSDEPGNDEHMTALGTEKGAEIVASLVENELQFGVQPHWKVEILKWLLEALLTVILLFLFHYRYTESWAIVPAVGIFILYLYFIPRLSFLVPDFRDYVFAIILAFWIEVLLKSAVRGFVPARILIRRATNDCPESR